MWDGFADGKVRFNPEVGSVGCLLLIQSEQHASRRMADTIFKREIMGMSKKFQTQLGIPQIHSLLEAWKAQLVNYVSIEL
ncbi:hypothetical protein ACMD2_25968 [Ananas comosus]|uniref:Uncharacterized protein n=1 Tax=Ananas comosus TaxID=4615 RepID=A0A199UVG4_ANACO|nr:hypothetical protein ACMD2_25968 [Ananas comosus]